MTAVAKPASVASLVHRAAQALAGAVTAAQVLDARDKARAAYDEIKRYQRMQKAKRAHDTIIAAAKRARADALEIEALAERRLADEYDGAQARGEVASGRPKTLPDGNTSATAQEIGLTSKDVFEARQVRDAIERNPRAVREALDDILAAGDEPTRAALKRAIAPVAKVLRAEDQAAKQERRSAREIELGARQAALPAKKYGIIVADPEWRFEPFSRASGMDRAADNHYPTSDLLTLMRRDVSSIADRDCVLFLWATAPMLIEAICVLDAWGFAWIDRDPATGFLGTDKARCGYVSSFAWVKHRAGTGYWNRGRHELLLVATRGNPVAPAMGAQLESVIEARAGRHSEKPDSVMDWIERTWPSTPKIELNARQARSGWDAWGFESVQGPPASTPPGERGADESSPSNSASPTSSPDAEQAGAVVSSSQETAPAASHDEGRRWPVDLVPPPGHVTQLTVGGMRKNGSAQLTFRRNGDGTFAIAARYDFPGFAGGSAPYDGGFADFADALAAGLWVLAEQLATVRDSAGSSDKHRAAARGGLAWIEARRPEWGLLA